ncbi:MAG TPA: SPOR domain-containing protein [Allosphingosinicella sp.]|jgi:cell division septation protein DedD|nr:SPOR domain-containing protein [Allosphingosinicella sp.]
MKTQARLWMLAAATALAGSAAFAQRSDPTGANDARAGVEAWRAQDYETAVRIWRPLADRGDADAQFNLAQAYFLGRGLPQNMTLAEQWYARAARGGHEEAQANYGLLLFQNGRQREAMPWIERAANRGDPRAQYVLGTALFNGDLVPQDMPRAYALMTRAAAQNLPPAVTQLAELDRRLSPQDRARGVEMARDIATAPPPTQIAAAEPSRPARVRSQTPPRARPDAVLPRTQVATARPTPRPAPAQAPVAAAAGGRWRVQLGAFSSDANARRAWGAVAGRLPGLRPSYVRAGPLIRVQAGPLRDRAAALRACAAAGHGCYPVAP